MLPELGRVGDPSAELRARLAEYLGQGWTIALLDASSAVVRRSQRSSALILTNPLYAFRRKRPEEVLLTLMNDGTVIETRRWRDSVVTIAISGLGVRVCQHRRRPEPEHAGSCQAVRPDGVAPARLDVLGGSDPNE